MFFIYSYFHMLECPLFVLLFMTDDYLQERYRSKGVEPFVLVFLREHNPYLCKVIQFLKETTENSEWLGRRA